MHGVLSWVRCLALAVVSGVVLAAPAGAQQGAPIPHGQSRPPGDPLSPAEAIARMTVPEGFRVELVASEPDLVNPVAMTFDERGRIWVTESLEYPRREPGPGRDRVKVLEDRDGDGAADTFTIFADGFNIPSGIAVGHGGVWVANAPDLLFLRDTDGDGKADVREVVVSGFGRADTHELPNSLTWGPDGWLYGWNGVFNPSKITHRGKTYQFTCAIFRINPRTRDFELFCEGTSNPWGIAWDLEGSAFASACVIDHLWHLTETGYYHRQGGPYPPFTWKIESIVEHRHQQAAYCGIHFFDSDAYPAEYRERLFMGNIHGNAVNVDRVERRGSTYTGLPGPDFLAANDAWFMPVSQKTGPDGSLYVLDWYDRYHCYQDARRDPAGIDRLKGRLYRVRYRETPRAAPFDLRREPDDQLIARLGSPNVFFRDLAQRVLSERNSPSANARLEARVLDSQAPRKARMHSLWARAGAGLVSSEFLGRLLDLPDPGFRAWGVRLAGNARRVDPNLRGRVAALARDPAPEVRLQVAIAARKLEGLDPLPVLMEVLAGAGDDPLIPQIVWGNLHPLLEEQGDAFVALIGRPEYRNAEPVERILPRAVDRLLGRRGRTPAAIVGLVKSLAAESDEVSIRATRRTLETLADQVQAEEIQGPMLETLRAGLEPVLRPFLTGSEEGSLKHSAAILATSWRDRDAAVHARRILRDRKQPMGIRLQALEALVAARDAEIIGTALGIVADRSAGPLEFRGQTLEGLGRHDDPRLAVLVLERYPSFEPSLQPVAIELLTGRHEWSLALLDAIGQGRVPADALNLNQIRKLSSSKHAALVSQVRQRYGAIREGRNPAREQVIERMRTLLREPPGNPHNGALVFQKLCGQCHKIHGQGQEVGPDLTLNGRGSYDQLLSNVFDPSLVIGLAYQAVTVATRDGRVLTGLIAEDSPARFVLKLQGGRLETIARDEIEQTRVSPLSLMPEDLEKQLTEAELRDLFAFLCLDRPPTDPSARPIPGAPKPGGSGERKALDPGKTGK